MKIRFAIATLALFSFLVVLSCNQVQGQSQLCAASIPAFETATKEKRVIFENGATVLFFGHGLGKTYPAYFALYAYMKSNRRFKCFDSSHFGMESSFRGAVANKDGSLIFVVNRVNIKSKPKTGGEDIFFRISTLTSKIVSIFSGSKLRIDVIQNVEISPNSQSVAFFAESTTEGSRGALAYLLSLGDFGDSRIKTPRGVGFQLKEFPLNFNVVGGRPCFDQKSQPKTCKPNE